MNKIKIYLYFIFYIKLFIRYENQNFGQLKEKRLNKKLSCNRNFCVNRKNILEKEFNNNLINLSKNQLNKNFINNLDNNFGLKYNGI